LLRGLLVGERRRLRIFQVTTVPCAVSRVSVSVSVSASASIVAIPACKATSASRQFDVSVMRTIAAAIFVSVTCGILIRMRSAFFGLVAHSSQRKCEHDDQPKFLRAVEHIEGLTAEVIVLKNPISNDARNQKRQKRQNAACGGQHNEKSDSSDEGSVVAGAGWRLRIFFATIEFSEQTKYSPTFREVADGEDQEDDSHYKHDERVGSGVDRLSTRRTNEIEKRQDNQDDTDDNVGDSEHNFQFGAEPRSGSCILAADVDPEKQEKRIHQQDSDQTKTVKNGVHDIRTISHALKLTQDQRVSKSSQKTTKESKQEYHLFKGPS